MNKIFMSQRLNARMQFKSLLMLSLLAGSASAQQSLMPTLGTELPSIDAVPAIDTVPSVEFVKTDVESLRSTWTLRQHATWLLGLKPRQVMSIATEPSVSAQPHIDIASAISERTPLPAALTPETQMSETRMSEAQLPEVPTDAVILVQHTEPATLPLAPALFAATEVAAAVHAQSEPVREEPAHQGAPQSLNLKPVVGGPVPALPLGQLTEDSLLQVDLSGVDVAKLNSPAPANETVATESLVEGLGFALPTSYTMSDNDDGAASLAASPAHAKPVSIHEGFAPRVSSANQAAQLSGDGPSRSSDRISISGPGPSHFSMSDKASAPTSGAVLNRLSDKESVQLTLGDRDEQPKNTLASKPIEKSFTDKSPVLTSLPVEVSSDIDKTSRSGKPVMLTPPSRLAQEPPLALPLSSALPIASTGVDGESLRSPEPSTALLKLPSQTQALAAPKLTAAKPEPQKTRTETSPVTSTETGTAKSGSEKIVSQAAPVDGKPGESLIDGLITSPGLLTATEPVVASEAPASPLTKSPSVDMPMDKPAHKPGRTDSVVAKAPQTKSERITLSDFNPLAMKRPVVKAASVAIPEVTDSDSVVVQSSHEVDDTSRQIAEYAKMAAKMQQAVKQKFPNVRVKITCNEDGLIVDGNLANSGEASKVLSFVRKASLCPVADRVTTSQ